VALRSIACYPIFKLRALVYNCSVNEKTAPLKKKKKNVVNYECHVDADKTCSVPAVAPSMTTDMRKTCTAAGSAQSCGQHAYCTPTPLLRAAS
jgi:hypothetical protein